MSTSDFNRGVDIIQNPVNAVRPQVAEEDAPKPTGLGKPRIVSAGPFAQEVLPGMEEFADQSDFEEPLLAGAAEPSAPIVEPPPPAGRSVGIVSVVALGAACILVGFLLAALGLDYAHTKAEPVVREVVREVVKEVPGEASGIPPELLGDSSAAAAWEAVANMRGEIGGTALTFSRGVATADGTTYRIVLDFHRDGAFTYAKVAGNGLWVAKVDASGTIVRAYRCPRSDLTLKALFGQ